MEYLYVCMFCDVIWGTENQIAVFWDVMPCFLVFSSILDCMALHTQRSGLHHHHCENLKS